MRRGRTLIALIEVMKLVPPMRTSLRENSLGAIELWGPSASSPTTCPSDPVIRRTSFRSSRNPMAWPPDPPRPGKVGCPPQRSERLRLAVSLSSPGRGSLQPRGGFEGQLPPSLPDMNRKWKENLNGSQLATVDHAIGGTLRVLGYTD